MSEKNENPCLKFDCSECCNPVKLRKGVNKELPSRFHARGEILAPESSYETTKLESFDCDNFDQATGLCKDYENRPKICQETKCAAFHETDEDKQAKIINEIRNEKFFIWKKRK